MNAAELEYIEQDNNNPEESKAQQAAANDFDNKKISFLQCFKFPQTWAVFVGKFMTDGVWCSSFLDSGIYFGCIWFRLRHRYCTNVDFRIIRYHHVIYLWW